MSNKIKKGDSFVCIKTVVMDSGEITYKKGFIYNSDLDNNITNIENNVYHGWIKYGKLTKKHFLRIKTK